MTFVVFDLHKRYRTACALDASGTVIAEILATKPLPTMCVPDLETRRRHQFTARPRVSGAGADGHQEPDSRTSHSGASALLA